MRKSIQLFTCLLFSCIFICLSSCKKDKEQDGNDSSNPLDTLSGSWVRVSENMYSQGQFQQVFELDGQIFSLNQSYPGNPAKIFKYTPLSSQFTPFHTFVGNMPYQSYCQAGNNVYLIMDYTTSTGGFGAIYNYQYQLYKISSQNISKIADVHNPENISLGSHSVFTQGADVYFAGYSKIPGSSQNGLTVYKLTGDSLTFISSKPSQQTGPIVINNPNAGAWVLQFNLNNGDYTQIELLKIDNGQIVSVKSGLSTTNDLYAVGGKLYRTVKEPNPSIPEYTNVYIENIETGKRSQITTYISYQKYWNVLNDKLFMSYATMNHTTDNHFIVLDTYGKITFLPKEIPGFGIISNYKQVKFFGESPSKYYLVVSNNMDNVLYSFSK